MLKKPLLQDIKLPNLNKFFSKNRSLLKNFVDSQDNIIYLKDENLNYLFVNKKFEKIFQINERDLLNKGDDALDDKYLKLVNTHRDFEIIENKEEIYEIINWNKRYFKVYKFPVELDNLRTGVGTLISDITDEYNDRVNINKTILRNDILINILTEKFNTRNEQLDYILDGSLKITESKIGFLYSYDEASNKFRLCSYKDDSIGLDNDLSKLKLNDIFLDAEAFNISEPVIKNDINYKFEHFTIKNFMSVPVIVDNKVLAVIGFGNKSSGYNSDDVFQIQELMSAVWSAILKFEKINYMSYHDCLTGLHNRRYFENKLKAIDKPDNLPISIIIGDLNGLKITNDIYGHFAGDRLLSRVAAIMKNSCRDCDVIARWGGDEYIILLPKTDKSAAEKIMRRIKDQFRNEYFRGISPSISLGCDTKVNNYEDIFEVLENAEARMYLEKSIFRNTNKTATIDSIVEFFHDNISREASHSKSVLKLCEDIGKALDLKEDEIRKLTKAAFLHDIGKTAIDDKWIKTNDILKGKALLKVKQHPVIGYRILSTFTETIDVADMVLYHHEKWDGTGYPRNLKGDCIPLFARIIAIAESFDAMTNKESYRKAIAVEEALKEIRNNSGTQFDPKLVDVFINLFD